MGRVFIDGNEAVAYGALAAGCDFFAGYPITPATSILTTMLKIAPARGAMVVQGEDEIGSLGFCLGASMAGAKTMTATSGPGISLCSEQISFAIGSEIPVVIVDVMRLGPSTGSATKGADGDVQFLRWSSSGGLPVICLAPMDAADCYELTVHAFNLAEKYRCPVFVGSSKEVGLTRESVDLDSIELPPIVSRKTVSEGESYLPFDCPDGTDVPFFAPIGGAVISRQTSSTHGPEGYITTDPATISANVERLARKIEANVGEFSFVRSDVREGADTLVLGYGVNGRAIIEACGNLNRSGRPVSLAVLKTIWPVPTEKLRELARGHKRIVVVEMNLGQYVLEIEKIFPEMEVTGLARMDGNLITPAEIEEVIYGDAA